MILQRVAQDRIRMSNHITFLLTLPLLSCAAVHLDYADVHGLLSIRTLAWNPTGQLIATGSAGRTLRIWNPERANAKYSTELRGHTAGIEKVIFNPVRDSELASCSSDGTVRFWDVRSKTCVSRLDVGGEAFTLSWSADGSVLLVGRKVSFPAIFQRHMHETLMSNQY
jgi:THO complex subunit 3